MLNEIVLPQLNYYRLLTFQHSVCNENYGLAYSVDWIKWNLITVHSDRAIVVLTMRQLLLHASTLEVSSTLKLLGTNCIEILK